MRGDIIIIDEHHRSAAATIVAHLLPVIPSQEGRYTVTVAGESGSGKSETAQAIAEEFGRHGLNTFFNRTTISFIRPAPITPPGSKTSAGWVSMKSSSISSMTIWPRRAQGPRRSRSHW